MQTKELPGMTDKFVDALLATVVDIRSSACRTTTS
jgi:hypothetical protein